MKNIDYENIDEKVKKRYSVCMIAPLNPAEKKRKYKKRDISLGKNRCYSTKKIDYEKQKKARKLK